MQAGLWFKLVCKLPQAIAIDAFESVLAVVKREGLAIYGFAGEEESHNVCLVDNPRYYVPRIIPALLCIRDHSIRYTKPFHINCGRHDKKSTIDDIADLGGEFHE